MTAQSNRISVYDSVTNNIIAKLEQGIAPWIKPWQAGSNGGADKNIISGKEYQGEPALFAVLAPQFREAQLFAVKVERLVEVGDAHHGVKVFHGLSLMDRI